jgi:hypothetical protein
VHLAIKGNKIIENSEEGENHYEEQPLGIVPVYIPLEENSHLSQYPFSSTRISIPTIYDYVYLDAELVFDCEIKYLSGQVLHIQPKKFTVLNNAQVSRDSSTKWSENLNWGANSKGIGTNWIDIRDFGSVRGNLESFNIVSYIKRGGVTEAYTQDTKINSYSFLYDELIDWSVKQINSQTETKGFEEILPLLQKANYPTKLFLSVGSTPTTELGEKVFLDPDDEVFMVVYNRERYSAESIKAYILAYRTRNVNYENMAILYQTAYMGNKEIYGKQD